MAKDFESERGKSEDLKAFWRRWGEGVEVAVAADGSLPDKLLGVRDGFLRYLHDGLSKPVPVSVSAQPGEDDAPLPLDDEETLGLAHRRALELAERLDDRSSESFSFVVGVESGLSTVECGDQRRHFVRTWTVVRAFGEESWGSSGAIQLPQRLIEGLDRDDLPFAVPGTRRGGGMMGSLTGGLETRRRAAALATFHALSSLFYGVWETSPGHRH